MNNGQQNSRPLWTVRQSDWQLFPPLIPKADLRPRIGALEGDATEDFQLPKRARCVLFGRRESRRPGKENGNAWGSTTVAANTPRKAKSHASRICSLVHASISVVITSASNLVIPVPPREVYLIVLLSRFTSHSQCGVLTAYAKGYVSFTSIILYQSPPLTLI